MPAGRADGRNRFGRAGEYGFNLTVSAIADKAREPQGQCLLLSPGTKADALDQSADPDTHDLPFERHWPLPSGAESVAG
jgi:hypothetical protein